MRLLALLFLLFTITSCKKKNLEIKYSISVDKDNPYPAELEINDTKYTIVDTYFEKEIVINKYDIIDVSLDYLSPHSDMMKLSLKRDNYTVASVWDNSYMWIVYSDISSSTSGNINISNNNTTWHYCGYPTKDGHPCQRHVSGTTGYCWQHR